MLNGINIEEVKQYNASVKEYQAKAAKIRAGIDYNNQELARLCGELTQELGVQVTPENIVQIYNDTVAKISNTLRVGNEILERIKQEESQADLAQQAPVYQEYIQTQQVASVPGGIQAPQAPQTPQAPQAPGVVPDIFDDPAMPSMFARN